MINLVKHLSVTALLLVSLLISPTKLKSQVNVQDSLTLVEFYWAANGPSWINDSNWLITPVVHWYGIGLGSPYGDSTHVWFIGLQNNNLNGTISPLLCQLSKLHGLNLTNNNLSGSIPPCFGTTQLTAIILSQNYLTNPLPLSLGSDSMSYLVGLMIDHNLFHGPFPDTILKNQFISALHINDNHFTSIGFDHTMNVQFYNNSFTFKDLAPYRQNNIAATFLMPQDSVLTGVDTTILLGSSFTMDSWVDTCSGNRYSWQKNGNLLNWNSINSSYTINNAQLAQSGNYTCQISNPSQCTGVFLWRKTIQLIVQNPDGITPDPQISLPFKITYRLKEQILDLEFSFSKEELVKTNIYDETGRKVLRLFEGNIVHQELHQYLGWMRKGLYIVRIETRIGTYASKIIVH